MVTVKELTRTEVGHIVDYWAGSSHEHLLKMGVEIEKLPSSKSLRSMLENLLEQPFEQRNSYCLIWFDDERPIGHCNTNPTHYGEEAFMHLHLWNPGDRGKGFGVKAVKLCIPLFMENLKLQRLMSQPKSDNTSANEVLKRCGFRFIKNYRTTPGSINYEQDVSLWTFEKSNS